MYCFRHSEVAAVGTCKHCSRGLCHNCATTVEDVLACRNEHERQVSELNRLTTRSIVQMQRAASGYSRNGIFYGLVALAFVALGVSQLRYLGLQAVFFTAVGLFLLYASIANILEARRFR